MRSARRIPAADLLGAAGRLSWRRMFPVPDDVEAVPVRSLGPLRSLPRGEALKVLVWNIQYCGSRRYRFFYDGGAAVSVPPEDVRWTLDQVAWVLHEFNPDLVLLQEVDRGSDRTGRVDQHEDLLEHLQYPCDVSTPYHRVGYVPHPRHAHLGRVDMHLSIFSRYAISRATRHQLPLLSEPWHRRLFNLRRALLEVILPVEGGGELRVFNSHLSAFSHGDGTLKRQIDTLDAHARKAEQDGVPFLLAGDFNSLPPGDDASRLGAEAVEYPEPITPVQLLFDHHTSAIPLASLRADPQRWRTYLPFGASRPDRTLDYAFVGQKIRSTTARVLPETAISDHLPLLLTITL